MEPNWVGLGSRAPETKDAKRKMMKIDTYQHTQQPGDPGQAFSRPKRDYWGKTSRRISNHAVSTGYPEAFIKLMRPRKNSTILDMACGGGTIAIPLAGKVQKVTVVDFSRSMLDMLERRCRERRIVNVDTIQGSWEDDWTSLGIGTHDIAIASRSIMADNPRGCIEKLCEVARRAVYISTVVGSGAHDRQLYEAAGRELNIKHDFIYYYNLLDNMGLHPHVEFVPETHRTNWGTVREALDGQRWMFPDGLSDEEEQRVKGYLQQHLVRRKDNRLRLSYPRQCFWAVMWWTVE